jgi:hypothetical protein
MAGGYLAWPECRRGVACHVPCSYPLPEHEAAHWEWPGRPLAAPRIGIGGVEKHRDSRRAAVRSVGLLACGLLLLGAATARVMRGAADSAWLS